MIPYVAGRRLSRLWRGPFNWQDDVCGPLVADEGWGMLHFVEGPCLQTLEHMEGPHGDHHPPMRLDRDERLLQVVRELKAGAHL